MAIRNVVRGPLGLGLLLAGVLVAGVQAQNPLGQDPGSGEGPDGRAGSPPGPRPGNVAGAVVAAPSRPRFVVGFNQAWLGNAYGSQWAQRFDEPEAIRMLDGTRGAGGTVLRMWLFEGLEMQGVVWDRTPGKLPAQIRTAPTGLDPVVLRNIERFLELAGERGVRVYLTLFDANIYSWAGDAHPRYRAEWWNLLNEKYGAGAGFRSGVLAPILEAVARHRQAVFALDLANEGNAWMRADWFEGGWEGARSFVRRWRTFVRDLVPDLPVGMSYGHHTAVPDLLAERIPPDLVDFYDFHVYQDRGRIPSAGGVQAFAARCGRPVYLGEFNQASKAYDDRLSATVTRDFMDHALQIGLAGAFAWRLSDVRPGENPEARHSFEAFGTWRPNYQAFRDWVAAHAADLR